MSEDQLQNNTSSEDEKDEEVIASNATPAAPDAEKQEDETEKYKKLAEEYLNGWKRAQADFSNYKKEEAKRFEDFAKFANEGLVKDLLAVLDSFDIATVSLDEKNPAQKGIAIMKSQFLNILKNKGVEEIGVKEGEDMFDPRRHEAVAESESDHPSDTILEVMEAGYMLHGKVIRPVKVKIAK